MGDGTGDPGVPLAGSSPGAGLGGEGHTSACLILPLRAAARATAPAVNE